MYTYSTKLNNYFCASELFMSYLHKYTIFSYNFYERPTILSSFINFPQAVNIFSSIICIVSNGFIKSLTMHFQQTYYAQLWLTVIKVY